MAGRPKKPRNQKIMQGTFRPDRDNNDLEFEKITRVPQPPSGLKVKGKSVWKIIATELVNIQLLSHSDLPILEEYCFQFDIIVEAKKEMKKGILIPIVNQGGGKSFMKNSGYAVYNEAVQKVYQLAQQFGFTPSSRAKIGGSGNNETNKKSDPSELLKVI